MQMNKRAYRYGKRLGNDVSETSSGFTHKFLTSSLKWETVKARLRETAGYEHTKHCPASELRHCGSDSFRGGDTEHKKNLNETVIPEFRKGFYEGLTN